jgi:hypothetical protein
VFITLAVPNLIALPREVKVATLEAGAALCKNSGAFTIEKQAEYWEQQRLALDAALKEMKRDL